MFHPRKLLSVCAAALASSLIGCAADPKPIPAAGRPTPRPLQLRVQEPPPETSSQATIDPRIVEACRLPTPKFEFDSAGLGGTAGETLQLLAKCMVSGPLAGRQLKLVGRADPRGTDDYNLALGHRRAGSVEEYLVAAGMSRARIATSSRGEFEAEGTDEQGWAEDRRVDIILGD